MQYFNQVKKFLISETRLCNISLCYLDAEFYPPLQQADPHEVRQADLLQQETSCASPRGNLSSGKKNKFYSLVKL